MRFFSIVIPTLNEEKNIAILLSAVKSQSFSDFEVIVVDSHSKDKTRQKALFFKKFFPFKFIEKKFKNVASARNYGGKIAKGEYLVFFDADVLPEKNFLKEIKEKIKKFNLDLLTVWNRAKESWRGKIIFTLMNICLSLFQKIKPAANGPCIIIKKSLFEKINGFDEEIFFGEDFDLVQRAVKVGGKFKVFKTPILYVSCRRFEKEGFFVSLYKSIKAIIYQLLFGPIKKPIFEYQMGGEVYKNLGKKKIFLGKKKNTQS